MNLPKPVAGLVISYSYLWHSEHARGESDGRKDRPCGVVLTVTRAERTAVVVMPVTHREPGDKSTAAEIAPLTKRRLGLDERRSWVVVTECNVFAWPGPDLRPRNPGDLATVAYGILPEKMILELRRRYEENATRNMIKVVKRSDEGTPHEEVAKRARATLKDKLGS